MHIDTPSAPSFPPRSTPEPPNGSCPVNQPNAPLEPSILSSPAPSRLNPLNYMFSNLSQSRASNQTVELPTDRETSSIPRGDAESNWEYPSPQQMYNAMLRKGYDDTPQDAVESMVAVHNFLNEGAWGEIVDWERRFSRGLGYGWQACRRGEEGFLEDADVIAPEAQVAQPKLLKFQGRPKDLTPKARIQEFMGYMYPAKYRSTSPLPPPHLNSPNLKLTTPQRQTPLRPPRLVRPAPPPLPRAHLRDPLRNRLLLRPRRPQRRTCVLAGRPARGRRSHGGGGAINAMGRGRVASSEWGQGQGGHGDVMCIIWFRFSVARN